MKNMTGNFTTNFHTNFWVANFPFFQKWHHACLWRAYTVAEFSQYIGYYLAFLPHLAQERKSPHPTKNIMTLFIAFATSYQYILAWATLYFPVLHYCIRSMLSCKADNHVAQGPKNDYKYAYSHPLSNLSPLQSPFWSLSVF